MRKARLRRRLSMTSLVDVIFLLLLFFMLSSTFTRHSVVELSAAGSGSGELAPKPLFLRFGPDGASVNGRASTLSEIPGQIAELATGQDGPVPVLVSLEDGVTAQRLTDLLVLLRGVAGIETTILGAS